MWKEFSRWRWELKHGFTEGKTRGCGTDVETVDIRCWDYAINATVEHYLGIRSPRRIDQEGFV